MSANLTIQIVSDPVCPWCYLGKRRLERALAERPGHGVAIQWLPFQLSPDLPREGRDRREHYASLFGEARAQEIGARMRGTAAAEGLDFELKPGARSPNTLSAHVLMYWAARDRAVDQTALAERLFHAHHVDCEDIGDAGVLARLAGEVGMNASRVLADLRAGRDEDAVRGLIDQVRAAGITGVPFFIFDSQLAVSGAQPPEALLEVIDRCGSG